MRTREWKKGERGKEKGEGKEEGKNGKKQDGKDPHQVWKQIDADGDWDGKDTAVNSEEGI